MNTKTTPPQTYTMPLKQLLKLLETTADETPRTARRPRGRVERSASLRRELAEPEYEPF